MLTVAQLHQAQVYLHILLRAFSTTVFVVLVLKEVLQRFIHFCFSFLFVVEKTCSDFTLCSNTLGSFECYC